MTTAAILVSATATVAPAPPAHAGHAISIMVAAVIAGTAGLILLGLAFRRQLELGRLPERAVERPLVDAPAARGAVARASLILIAVLAAGIAVLLLTSAIEHGEALGPVAWLLAVAGAVEAAWAVAVIARPGRRWALFGLVLNLGVVGLAVVARAAGLAGLESGAAGSAGAIAAQLAVAAAFAILLIVAIAWLEFGLPHASETRLRQLGTVVSVAALPVLSLVVLATIVVVGGTAFPNGPS